MPEESKEELEKQKIQAEIKNLKRPPFKTPVFWAPLFTSFIALVTYLFFWQSGFFDMKMAHINYIADSLNVRAKALDTVVKGREIFAKKLQHDNDSLVKVNKDLADKFQAADSARKISAGSLTEQEKKYQKLIIDNNNLKSEKAKFQDLVDNKDKAYLELSTNYDKILQGKKEAETSVILERVGHMAEGKRLSEKIENLKNSFNDLKNSVRVHEMVYNSIISGMENDSTKLLRTQRAEKLRDLWNRLDTAYVKAMKN